MSKLKNISILFFLLVAFSVLNLSSHTQAAEWSGGFVSGHLTWGVGSGSSSIATTAASQWNGASSKASYTYSSGSNQYGSTAQVVTHFNSINAPLSGDLGVMYPYKTWTGTSATSATLSDTWVKAMVYQYKTTLLDTDTKRTATATHEMGHALSMAHPPGESTLSIMVQGVKTDYSIQLYDRLSLQQKWGK
ncbi:MULTISPECIES: hypothetical protein [Lysinibacillus]|uniref:hypothetical protein n=1 Tax=Lysinibacillus TaxID=400634 RepID=UPI001C8C1E4D|nr:MULTISPECIES: hypothetical protein [Lysinibacillus]MBX8943542.1 hypothetical protein [Lysinibacillus sp. K60]